MPKPRASSRLSLGIGIARGPVLNSLSAAVNFKFHFFLHTFFSLGGRQSAAPAGATDVP